MRIYSMTATFGKLEHETLTLEPGLNVISAGNEWGKSTWCAFLTAMLYGLDTRAKTTKTALADKEHYAPWSGSPMSGRIDLCWNGRDITIERSTRGRVPMGQFRAYETDSGLEIAELNAHNCGQRLLGVERSVFLRSAFLRQNDMSLTDDEALRRRLNALVATGDENSAADRLAAGLKELKNKIRYNRTGLLPQAEAERDRLDQVDRELTELEDQLEDLERRMDENEDWRMALENHRDALRYQEFQENQAKLDRARRALSDAQDGLAAAEETCGGLPPRETAEGHLSRLNRLEQKRLEYWTRIQALQEPEEEADEEAPSIFQGLSGEAARRQSRLDAARYRVLTERTYGALFFGLVLLVAGLLIWEPVPWLGIGCTVGGGVLLMGYCIRRTVRISRAEVLAEPYGSRDPGQWIRMADEYAEALDQDRKQIRETQRQRGELMRQLRDLEGRIRHETGDRDPGPFREEWERVISGWNGLELARQECRRAGEEARTLESLIRPAQSPVYPDRLDQTEPETLALLRQCYEERRRLENLLGQYQGRKAALEDRETLQKKWEQADTRIRQLEKTYDALTIAQVTLADAAAELQRRFAPRIAKRAGALMERMTDGRYDRVSLGDDLSLRAGTQREDTLHEALWRSDGTVDQLYLALRLAVAEELLPQAPLILDDALVRFDDTRLKAAMEILQDAAKTRQVILFSCHSREKNLIG